jgi:splicing factor, arginine/serine-rich 7
MTTVYIGNLDFDATPYDLHDEFDRYGQIRDIWIARHPPGN